MKLVERDKELAILGGMLDASAAGHGGVALISGAVASGKTALLRAFGERVGATGALFLQATGSGFERDLPLGVMGQLLLGADLPEADTALATRLLDLVAVTAPVRAAEGAIPAELAINVFPRLCGILLAQARRRPVVLSIDDVHHADAHSLECVLYLARRLEVSRILVVLGESGSFPWEDSRFRDELLHRPGCRHLRLDLLPWQGVTEMITAGLGGRRARPLASDFHWLSGGSPLLMRALLEDYHASERAGSAELVPGEAFEQAVTSCLYRSDIATRRAAWALAVLGPDISHDALAEVLGACPESADRSLTALGEMGLLSSGWFRHEAGRAAVLQSMEPPHRARLEARTAEVLHDRGEPAIVLARHLIVAEPIEASWTLPTLLEAAERALDEDEVGLALDCLRVAGDSCADERQDLTVRAALIRAGWRINPSDAAGHLPALTGAALEGRLGARDTKALVGCLLWFGKVDEALGVLGAASARRTRAPGEDAPVRGRPVAEGPATEGPVVEGPVAEAPRVGGGFLEPDFVRLWMTYGYPGLPGARRPGLPGAEHRRPGDGHAQGPEGPGTPAGTPAAVPGGGGPSSRGAEELAMSLLDRLLGQGTEPSRGAAAEVTARAEEVLESTRLKERTLPALMAAVATLVFADELGKAARWCDALYEEATERHAPMWQSLAAAAKALVDIRRGGLSAAEESAHTALTLVSPEGWGAAIATPVAALLYTKAMMGRFDEAAAHLSVPVPEAAFRTPGGLFYLWARGHYYLAVGRPYAALDDFHACGDLMIKWELDFPAFVPWRTDAAQAYLSLGDEHRARALAEEQLVRVGTARTWMRGVSLRVLAATVEPGKRPRFLSEAVEILRERGHRLELARAMDELALAYRELGDEGRARALARKALQLMRESGVEPPAEEERIRRAEPAAPAPDEQPWSPGELWQPGELSEAELRVATLAARGHTNRQIAGKLFITVSTVEQHLTRVYRKLDVQRRTDLAAKLRSDVAGPPGRPEGGREAGTVRNRLRAV
ncbi:helix-turn-helix transcriptional regulator [Streptomyces sp. NPDC054796]